MSFYLAQCAEFVESIKRGASGKDIENHVNNDGAGVEIHLGGDEAIDYLIDTELPTEGGDDREVMGLANVEFFGEIRKWAAHEGIAELILAKVQVIFNKGCNSFLMRRLQIHLTNIYHVRNVCSEVSVLTHQFLVFAPEVLGTRSGELGSSMCAGRLAISSHLSLGLKRFTTPSCRSFLFSLTCLDLVASDLFNRVHQIRGTSLCTVHGGGAHKEKDAAVASPRRLVI